MLRFLTYLFAVALIYAEWDAEGFFWHEWERQSERGARAVMRHIVMESLKQSCFLALVMTPFEWALAALFLSRESIEQVRCCAAM